MSARLAAADHRDRQRALWIGPHGDIGQPGMPECTSCVATERTETLGPQHVSGAPAHRRQPGRQVGAQPAGLFGGGAQRLRREHPHTVEFASTAENLGEPGQFVGVGHGVRGRDDAGEEFTCIRERDDLLRGTTHRGLERLGDRGGQRLAGDVARGDQCDILGRNTVIGPAESQRAEDLVGEDVADAASRCRRDDLTHQRTPCHTVVDVHQAGPVDRLHPAQHVAGVLTVVHPFEIGLGPRRERDARTVGHHMTNGGAVLAVAGVIRQVVTHPVLQREGAALDQHVGHRGGDRLGRGVHAERGAGADRDVFGINGIGGSVAPAVADGTIEDHLSVATQADLDGRLHAGGVPVPRGIPDSLHGNGIDLGVIFLGAIGDGLQIDGHTDAALVGHGCSFRSTAARWCCSGWPTAAICTV